MASRQFTLNPSVITSLQRIPPKQEGLSITLFMIVLVIAGGALMATTTRAWLGYKGVLRQSQARSAREIAEAGSIRLIEDLNSNYSHLLVTNNDEWGTASSLTGVCSNDTAGTPQTTGNIGSGSGAGRYSLDSYSYNGSPFFGGTATIRVKGELLNSSNTPISTSIIEQSIQIIPKTCDSSFRFPTNEPPGLVAQTVDIGNGDVEGNNAGVMCLQCNYPNNNDDCVGDDDPVQSYSQSEKECLIRKKSQSSIDGEIYIGPLDLPPVPTPASALSNVTPASITSNKTITSGSSDEDDLLDGACINVNNTTQCLISEIDLRGTKKLQINTSSGTPVRIFVTGNITLKGSSQIRHITNSSQAAMVGLFGNIANNDDTDDQTISLRGGTQIYNIWMYFPDANVGINGGGNVDNIYGTVWAKSWDGSSSNVANIVVPPDMAEGIENFFEGASIGAKDYLAVSASKWRTLITK